MSFHHQGRNFELQGCLETCLNKNWQVQFQEHVLYCLIMGVLQRCRGKSLDFCKYWEVCHAKKMDLGK